MVPWICCQLGAREHYAIPRALFRIGMLECLVTDAWVPPSSLLAKAAGAVQNSGIGFTAELRDARVKAFNSSLVLFEMLARARELQRMAKNTCPQPLVPTQGRVHALTLSYQLSTP